ncbi:MAG TPA: hypothetical protein VK154_15030 [Chitinophagales bacterium]|nr:hypothetical protein [Chitinophagales bacterium]
MDYLTHNSAPVTWDITDISCTQPVDTLYTNLPYNFDTALAVLHSHFKTIDSCGYNRATSSYLKTLVIADFTYAAFSFQYLGPYMGYAADTVLAWQSIPLSTFYNVGNANQTSLYCTERTIFFLRLTDSLLGIKGRPITVSQIHTFPVVYLGADTFIIDPSDPFVAFDTLNQSAASYSTLLKGNNIQHIIPLRTKRLFGNTRQLISTALAQKLQTNECDTCLCSSLQKYVALHKEEILSNVRPCFQLADAPLYNHIKVLSPQNRNSYAVETTGRIDGQLNSTADILLYYKGVPCNEHKNR